MSEKSVKVQKKEKKKNKNKSGMEGGMKKKVRKSGSEKRKEGGQVIIKPIQREKKKSGKSGKH